jgi:short-subunit dehydrogenase
MLFIACSASKLRSFLTGLLFLAAVTVAMAVDLKKDGITVISMCPGWVATDMGSTATGTLGIEAPPLEAPESISCQLKVIDGLTLEKSGTFFNHEGAVVPY